MSTGVSKAGLAGLLALTGVVVFLAGSRIEDGYAQEQQQAQTRGIDWVNLSTGTDHNAFGSGADDRAMKKKRYFVSDSEERRIARRKAVRREQKRRQKEEERYGY